MRAFAKDSIQKHIPRSCCIYEYIFFFIYARDFYARIKLGPRRLHLHIIVINEILLESVSKRARPGKKKKIFDTRYTRVAYASAGVSRGFAGRSAYEK